MNSLRYCLITLGLLCCFPFLHATQLTPKTTFTFLHVNDIYQAHNIPLGGSLASLATLIHEQRQHFHDLKVTFGGDLLSPSMHSRMLQGKQMIHFLNVLGIDYAVPGNHEFDYGLSVFQERLDESSAQWLGTNLRYHQSPFPHLNDHIILEQEGHRIALFGLITPHTKTISAPLLREDNLHFAQAISTAQKTIASLKNEGVEAFVLLSHLGLEDDRKLAQAVPEINVILGGHDHLTYLEHSGKTLLVQAGFDAIYAAVIHLKLFEHTNGETVVVPEGKLIQTSYYEEEPAFSALIDHYDSLIDHMLGDPLVQLKEPLRTERQETCQQSTPWGLWSAHALQVMTHADIVMLHCGALRGHYSYPKGHTLTAKDIYQEFPFNDKIALLSLDGASIRLILENAVSDLEVESGKYMQLAGLSFEHDPTAPLGQRLLSVTLANGKPLDPKAHYTVAVSDYIAQGRDGFDAFLNGTSESTLKSMRGLGDWVVEYLSKQHNTPVLDITILPQAH